MKIYLIIENTYDYAENWEDILEGYIDKETAKLKIYELEAGNKDTQISYSIEEVSLLHVQDIVEW